MVACVKLESAASGSWNQAAGVRGKCVTTQPPAPLINEDNLSMQLTFADPTWWR